MKELGEYLDIEQEFDYIKNAISEYFEDKEKLNRYLYNDLKLTRPYPDTIEDPNILFNYYLGEIIVSETIHDYIREDRSDFGINIIETKDVYGYLVVTRYKCEEYYDGFYINIEDAQKKCRSLLVEKTVIMNIIYEDNDLKKHLPDYEERSKWITNFDEFDEEFTKDVLENNVFLEEFNQMEHKYQFKVVKILI